MTALVLALCLLGAVQGALALTVPARIVPFIRRFLTPAAMYVGAAGRGGLVAYAVVP